MWKQFKENYIGDRKFWRMIAVIALPLVIQQGVTNLVSLLDNIMVGALGEISLSGVSIINQLFMVFNLTLFGILSGASIFGAQFYGVLDWKGMRDTFRFRIVFGTAVTVLGIGIFLIWGDSLSMLFLDNENNSPAAVAETLGHAMAYLRISLWGLIPFMLSQTYAGLLRETGHTLHPMIASVIAIVTNLVLNYCLIYGAFFFPQMGVAGAALATVIARILEAAYVMVYTHLNAEKYPFIIGAFRSLHIPPRLCRDIFIKGAPIMLNESLWSVGMTVINSSLSSRGLEVVAANNIATTAWNLFCVLMFAMGTVVSITVGQQLGAGNIELAKQTDRRLIFFTLITHVLLGAMLFLVSPLIPLMYEVSGPTHDLAVAMLRVQGIVLPAQAFIHVVYFTLRSGGKTLVTFFFDCVFTLGVSGVLSVILCRMTDLPILTCYILVQSADLIKILIAIPLLKSGCWAKTII